MTISFTRRTLAPVLFTAFLAAAAISLVLMVSPSFVTSALQTTEDSVGGLADDECDDLILTLTLSDPPTYQVVEIRLPNSASAGFVSFRRDDENLIISVEVWDAAPTLSTPTASGDDVSTAYTRSSVTTLSSHHYVFELHQAATSSGMYSFESSLTASSSPAEFEDVDRGKWYKTRAKRCETSDGKVCGPWSSLTSAVEVWEGAPPPTSLSLTRTRLNTLSATFTQSTWGRSSNHFYLIQLLRSETGAGKYGDYPDPDGVRGATSPIALGTVHTGYYYKVQAQRCKTSARTVCGSWSTPSSAVNVPATSAASPDVMTPMLSKHDELSVSFTRGSSAPRSPPPTHVVQLLESSTSTGIFIYNDKIGKSATAPVIFSDVEINRYYKARGKTCADSAGKLCGPWSANSSSMNVPKTTFPTLTAPTIAVGATGTIVASFSLPSSTYGYRLNLIWSLDDKDYDDHPSDEVLLSDSATQHTFTGLDLSNGRYYKTEFTACTDAEGLNCGATVTSTSIQLLTLSVDKVGDIWIVEDGYTVMRGTAAVATGQAYQLIYTLSTTGANVGGKGIRFNACNIAMVSTRVTQDLAASNMNTSWGAPAIALHACSVATATLTISLKTGGTEVASISRTLNVLGIPSEARVNGDSRDFSGAPGTDDQPTVSGPRFVLRWQSVTGASSYKIRHAEGFDALGNAIAIGLKIWTETPYMGTSSKKEKTITGLTDGKIYEVQVKSVGHGLTTAWSSPVFVRATSATPTVSLSAGYSFARIPIKTYIGPAHYSYTLCLNSFPDSPSKPRTLWTNDIRAGIQQWANAVDWQAGTRNIITVAESTSHNCKLTEMIKWEGSNNEVLMPATLTMPGGVTTNSVFDEYCPPIMNQITLACTAKDVSGGLINMQFMAFNTTRQDWNPGSDPHSHGCSHLFQTALHEAGHAYGFDHSPIENSVMKSGRTLNRCHITALDVGAIMNNYQSRTPTSIGGP